MTERAESAFPVVTVLRCAWCNDPVAVPQPGWSAGRAAYCVAHRSIDGAHPYQVGQVALADAVDLQDTPEGDFLRWPWAAVHDLGGVLVPRRVHYVAAFPGNGKTSFLAACLARWIDEGKRVTYLPLESDPLETMTRIACARVGVSADEALSMRLRLRADMGDPVAVRQLADLHAMFTALRQDADFLYTFRIDPRTILSPKTFGGILKTCAAMESDVLIVDHVDHSESDDRHDGGIQTSNRIQQMALDGARELAIPVILATQLNSSRTGNDRLAHFRPPIMDWLVQKQKKEQIAAVCLGLYRPLDPDRSADFPLVRSGAKEPWQVAKQGRMGVAGMKIRYGGERKERTVELLYEHGVLSDLPDPDRLAREQRDHGIRTSYGY